MTQGDHTQPRALKCPQCGGNLPPGASGFIICQYCGSSLLWEPPKSAVVPPEEAAIRGIRFKPFTYTDTEGAGMEMFRLLAPVGWQFQGGCRWQLDNPGMPAAINFQLWNPQGAELFEVLPNINCVWNTAPMAQMMFPVGSCYFGAEVRQPMPLRQALRELILPRYRARVQGLQIIAEEALPDLPRLVRSEAPLSGGSAEGGKVRIRYTWQNWPLEEDIFGVVELFRAPLPSAFGRAEVIFWFVDYLFSCRAGAGKLDATGDLFKVMLGSFRLNPHWYAAYKTMVQTLAQQQIQHIRHIGEIGRIIAQTSSQMREQNLNDWYARQTTYDRLADDHSRAIRGVDAFFDPHREEVVELPSGYGHAWANNLGEYIITESADFNPNIGSNLNWEPMEPK